MPEKTIVQYGATEFQRWCEGAESGWTDVKEEYEKAREYYENVQAPSDAPANKEWVQENLITDLVNGQVGQMVGGRVDLNIKGGGKMGKQVRELVDDIIKANKFTEKHLEPIANMFYTEGLGGLYIPFNPYRLTPYGIGWPEIYTLITSKGELLLDDSSRGFMHEDDTYRIFKTPRLVEYIESKWKHLKGKVKQTHTRSGGAGQQENYADVYTLEYRVADQLKIEDLPEGLRKTRLLKSYNAEQIIELDTFYQAIMVNRDLEAEGGKKTGFNRFRIIPVIHTPRLMDKKWPMGLGMLMAGTQDQINVVGSVALEAVKADIKNLILLMNASPDEEKRVRTEAAKTNGVVAIQGNDVKVQQMQRQGISPSLLQWYEWKRRAFDEVSGRYAPEKGASDTGLSGKAIGLLQQRGTVPELTRKLHVEYAFSEMASVILECVNQKMSKQPIMIERQIEGEDQKIPYNMPIDDVKASGVKINEEYMALSADGIVNDLSQIDIDDIDIDVEVVFDTYGKEQFEANKALTSRNQGLVSTVDALKKLYPSEWRDMLDNLTQENMAMKILGQLQKMGPEALKRVSTQADQIENVLNEAAGQQQ